MSELDPREEAATLTDLLLSAERFCGCAESSIADLAPQAGEGEELRLKIAQARSVIEVLQQAFEEDELTLKNAAVRANFRHLVLTLMWVAFYARRGLDFKTFRMLVVIESGFTYLLNLRG